MLSVKNIFKCLIGTMVVIVVASFTVEIINISTTGLQINRISRLAGKQSCVLFSQETYKQYGSGDSIGGSVNQSDVINTNGNIYVEGKFYQSDNPAEIYNSLYTSQNFKDWVQNSEAVKKGNWYNLKLIDKALNHKDTLNVKYGEAGYDEAMTAKLYSSVMMTPSNLGIPYLDNDVVNRMFRWNLAQLFSNCNSKSILVDESGDSYISFSGFRIYADRANISNIEYKTFDLTDGADRIEFNNITNINPDNLGFVYDSNLKNTINSGEDERRRVCLVGINYELPITYSGITPIQNIFNYIWNNEVEGLDNSSGRTTNQQYTTNVETLQSGGLYGNKQEAGVMPIPGKLIYYIIR